MTNGRLTAVWVTADSSTLAFSAASNSRCSACGSLAQVDAVVLLELVGEVVDDPPVEVVAAQMRVAGGGRTSTTPSPTSRMLTSNVPPPRSKTSTVSFSFLSRP